MIKAIIIDDEKSGRETLKFILESYYSNRISVIDMAPNVEGGIDLVRKYQPDLIFLDIEMPGENGLDIKNKANLEEQLIIVTTAHKQYGVDAIKIGVLDYLLKPIDPDDLELSIQKVEKRLKERNTEDKIKELISSSIKSQKTDPKVSFYLNSGKTIFVNPNNILYCEADGNYTKIVMTEKESILVTKQLKEVLEILHFDYFFRVHKSYLINTRFIKSYSKSDETIQMSDDSNIPLSRNLKAAFHEKMKLE